MFATLKHLGYNEWWSVYKRRGGGYDTAEQIGPYKVEIQEDLPYIDILIWNPKEPCVHMAIDMRNKIAVLNSVGYNAKCTVDGRMKRGEDTRKMVEFAFKFAKEHGATRVQLTDKSTVDCDGKDVDLSMMSLFKYGKTWYERRFNFYPVGSRKDDFEDMRSKLPHMVKPCEFFTPEMVSKLSKEYNMDVRYAVTFEKML
jgi:hypothetical protein